MRHTLWSICILFLKENSCSWLCSLFSWIIGIFHSGLLSSISPNLKYLIPQRGQYIYITQNLKAQKNTQEEAVSSLILSPLVNFLTGNRCFQVLYVNFRICVFSGLFSTANNVYTVSSPQMVAYSRDYLAPAFLLIHAAWSVFYTST